MEMSFAEAERFLKDHYQDDELDAARIRADDEHWERVLGDAERFPNADLDFIGKFGEAATTYLALTLDGRWAPHQDYAGEPMQPGEFRDPPQEAA